MKNTILILTIFSSTLFANYNYSGNNMGNIDMHGGKGQKLVPNQMKMNNFNGFNNLSITKPKNPTKPEVKDLVEEKKKDKTTNE